MARPKNTNHVTTPTLYFYVGKTYSVDAAWADLRFFAPGEWETYRMREYDYDRAMSEKALNDFIIRAFIDEKGTSYGWTYGFSTGQAFDASDWETHKGVFERVTKGLIRSWDKEGPCETFGEYVRRVASIIGVKCVAISTGTALVNLDLWNEVHLLGEKSVNRINEIIKEYASNHVIS